MRRSLVLFCVFVAALGLPAPRRSILGRLGAATTGIAIGSSATSMATGIASQSLGLAGQALGQIPFLGPLAQIGTSLGRTGVEVGNSFAQMGLGIGQTAVNSHAVGAAPIRAGVAQNIIKGSPESTRASVAPVQGGNGPIPANQPNAANQQVPEVPSSNDGFGPQNDYDYYGAYDDGQDDWNGQDDADVQQEATSRPPPPQPIYVGAK